MDDRFGGGFHERIIHRDFQFHFRQQTGLHFRATVNFRESALASAATHVRNRHQINIALGQSCLNGLEFLGPDDRHNHFHVLPS